MGRTSRLTRVNEGSSYQMVAESWSITPSPPEPLSCYLSSYLSLSHSVFHVDSPKYRSPELDVGLDHDLLLVSMNPSYAWATSFVLSAKFITYSNRTLGRAAADLVQLFILHQFRHDQRLD